MFAKPLWRCIMYLGGDIPTQTAAHLDALPLQAGQIYQPYDLDFKSEKKLLINNSQGDFL